MWLFNIHVRVKNAKVESSLKVSCVIIDRYANCFISDSASSASKVVETKTNDIVAMISPEKERVPLGKVQ